MTQRSHAGTHALGKAELISLFFLEFPFPRIHRAWLLENQQWQVEQVKGSSPPPCLVRDGWTPPGRGSPRHSGAGGRASAPHFWRELWAAGAGGLEAEPDLAVPFNLESRPCFSRSRTLGQATPCRVHPSPQNRGLGTAALLSSCVTPQLREKAPLLPLGNWLDEFSGPPW